MRKNAPKTFDDVLAELAERADVLRFAAERSRAEVLLEGDCMEKIIHHELNLRCHELLRIVNCLLQDTSPSRAGGKKSRAVPQTNQIAT